jgi:hypothetical protein
MVEISLSILYYAMLCYTILYYTILYYTIQYNTILYYTILCHHTAGHGVCEYANKNIYDGDWVNNRRCGTGSLTFRNGDIFVGHFLDDVMHGQGSYAAKGCAPVEAEWVRGDRVVPEVESSSSEEEDTEEKFDFENDSALY